MFQKKLSLQRQDDVHFFIAIKDRMRLVGAIEEGVNSALRIQVRADRWC